MRLADFPQIKITLADYIIFDNATVVRVKEGVKWLE